MQYFYRGVSEPRQQFEVRGSLKAHTRKTPRRQWGSNLWSIDYESNLFYQLSYPGPLDHTLPESLLVSV